MIVGWRPHPAIPYVWPTALPSWHILSSNHWPPCWVQDSESHRIEIVSSSAKMPPSRYELHIYMYVHNTWGREDEKRKREEKKRNWKISNLVRPCPTAGRGRRWDGQTPPPFEKRLSIRLLSQPIVLFSIFFSPPVHKVSGVRQRSDLRGKIYCIVGVAYYTEPDSQ